MPISKRNRRGVLWLLLISMVIVYSPRVLSSFQPNNEIKISYTELIEVEKNLRTDSNKEKLKNTFNNSPRYHAPKTKFNPNELSTEDWMKLGVTEKQAEVITRFTLRGISSNEELKRIYVLPEELFELIKDSTYYPARIQYAVNEKKYVKAEIEQVDLNLADEEQLISLPGIGPFYAKKIVDYRTKLGGYIGTHQLLEIWKFDTEKLAGISNHIVLSDQEIVKLNINHASVEELAHHPYIDYSVANSIVKMRKFENFKSLSDITRSMLIDEELFEKLKPYLTIDEH